RPASWSGLPGAAATAEGIEKRFQAGLDLVLALNENVDLLILLRGSFADSPYRCARVSQIRASVFRNEHLFGPCGHHGDPCALQRPPGTFCEQVRLPRTKGEQPLPVQATPPLSRGVQFYQLVFGISVYRAQQLVYGNLLIISSWR